MPIIDEFTSKAKTKIRPTVTFTLEYNAQTQLFIRGVAHVIALSEDETEIDGVTLSLEKFGLTPAEKDAVETLFGTKVSNMLTATGFTILGA
jgi:hypothetical protein